MNEDKSRDKFEVQLQSTVNPQKRPPGPILSLRVQMQVLLEFEYFCLLFLSLLRVLLEFGSYSRAGLFRGFTIITN